MAELFLAKQVGLDGFEKVVAIKRILAHLAHDQDFVQMFQDEARIVAKLHHPNIVQIYDLGKSGETYFIAMEYIPGRNLSSVAKKARAKAEPLPPTHIARCISQACEGLYYAHTRDDTNGQPLEIVHRDVSPQNIIVSFSGSVKLVDFGIAKAATKIAHTRAGVLKGKYAYMSPEQIRGERTDARSDLFAVGIVLYELLCGRRPFEKENSIQTLKAIVQEEPVPCQSLNDDIPDVLAAIIERCLKKTAGERYQTAQDVQLALEDFVSSAPQRVNNLVISQWVTALFAEELSKKHGGTVNLPGVGDVVLPDPQNAPGSPAQPAPAHQAPGSVSSQPTPINPAAAAALASSVSASPAAALAAEADVPAVRGGGSVSLKGPVAAPSTTRDARPLVDEIPAGRSGLIREGIIERAAEDIIAEISWDEAATVHLPAADPTTSPAPVTPHQRAADPLDPQALDPAALARETLDPARAKDALASDVSGETDVALRRAGRGPREDALGRGPREDALGRGPREDALGRGPREDALGRDRAKTRWAGDRAKTRWAGDRAKTRWAGDRTKTRWGGDRAKTRWAGDRTKTRWAGDRTKTRWAGDRTKTRWAGDRTKTRWAGDRTKTRWAGDRTKTRWAGDRTKTRWGTAWAYPATRRSTRASWRKRPIRRRRS